MVPKKLDTADDFEAAFLAWNSDLFGFIFVRVRERHVAEDLTQELFLKAWRARTSFNPKKASLKTWLYTIAINTTHDFFRRQKHRYTKDLDEAIPSNIFVDQEYVDTEARTVAWKKLRTLSASEQELIVLRYVQGLSIKEMCAILGKRESAVKVALHRGMQKLRDLCNRTSS